MKKYVSATLAALLFTSSAFAANQNFYSVDVQPGPFYVYGVTADKEKNSNPACYGEVSWRDGSKLQLIRDLADGELYIWFQNFSWNIGDAPGSYQLRAIFTRADGGASNLQFNYTLLNKNTIVIRNIFKDKFLPMFQSGSMMRLVMPGNIVDAEINLLGSSRTLQEISACVERSSAVNLYPDGALNTRNVPELKI